MIHKGKKTLWTLLISVQAAAVVNLSLLKNADLSFVGKIPLLLPEQKSASELLWARLALFDAGEPVILLMASAHNPLMEKLKVLLVNRGIMSLHALNKR